MAERNGTGVTGFLLTGLLDRPEVLFAAFHAVYSATLLANGALLLTLCADRHLHMPIYFFLANLSLLDVSRPMAALYFLVSPAGMDVLLLAVTASERFGRPTFLHAFFTFTLTFSRSNLVDQYYCDIPPVTGLSRSGEPLAEEKCRAWSTCTSRLLVVGLFYGPVIFTYVRQSSGHSPGSDGLVGMLYGVLNPLLDGLRI
ncbi:olfactory receptor 1020-like [Tachyglossus aculeatus]|uniref:olfactory receptor 1020-like n=1 Tax=Tachyglossus aculeatus TaxID=9261 RepID=UPI0018F57372|nr:olfactory receptor 1020-like [Tachyglossus aculeatus]